MDNIESLFARAFGASPAVVARAPGRIEMLGNHTDYNGGLTLSAAVDLVTEFAVLPMPGSDCVVRSTLDSSAVVFNLDRIGVAVPGEWGNYVKGVIVAMRRRGFDIGAFHAMISSGVPPSAGMSSSAALEISAAKGLAMTFDLDIANEDIARIGQEAENDFIKVNTGLLDQFSSMFGRRDSLIMCDFRDNRVTGSVALPAGHALVVANSMVKHDLVSSEYNLRRRSCERTVAALAGRYPEVKSLREANLDMLESIRPELRIYDYRRAKHVIDENQRVLDGVKALNKGDIDDFGRLMFESHESSRTLFENSCRELDFLVAQARSLPGGVGARLSGGGFGGISVHLVEATEAEKYARRLASAFKLRFGETPEIFICGVGDGAAALNP